jgi:signal transduction histidine kinase
VVGNVAGFRKILTNLVGDAVRFTERGEIVVEVRKKAESDDCAMFHFSVRDTGIEIPLEKQWLIFNAFSQEDLSTSPTSGDPILGLTIRDRLANLMGSRIWVESEVGRGSTFHFTVELDLA